MTAYPERKPDALDLAETICRFAGELNDAAESVFMAHRDASIAPPVPLSIGYSRDVANRLLAALDAYEART